MTSAQTTTINLYSNVSGSDLTSCSNVANLVSVVATVILQPGGSITYIWGSTAVWTLQGLEVHRATRHYTNTSKPDEPVSLSSLGAYLQNFQVTPFTPPSCSGMIIKTGANYAASNNSVTLQAKTSIAATSQANMQTIKISHRLWLSSTYPFRPNNPPVTWCYIDPEVDIDVPCT